MATADLVRFKGFQTSRLIANSFSLEDANKVAKLVSDWEVAKWTASIPHPYSVRDAERWITAQSEQPDSLVYALHFRKELIGCISWSSQTGEVGFWIGRTFWNRGFATEALCALVDKLSREHAPTLIWAACLPNNAASIRVLIKAGFSQVGHWEVNDRVRHRGTQLVRFDLQIGKPTFVILRRP